MKRITPWVSLGVGLAALFTGHYAVALVGILGWMLLLSASEDGT